MKLKNIKMFESFVRTQVDVERIKDTQDKLYLYKHLGKYVEMGYTMDKFDLDDVKEIIIDHRLKKITAKLPGGFNPDTFEKSVRVNESTRSKDYFTGSAVVKAPKIRDDYDKRQFAEIKEKIVKLGEDIHALLDRAGLSPEIELFYSGYRGMSVKWKGGSRMIIDQPGKVGLEDQQMPYIEMGDIRYSPDYFSRGFGNVKMEDKMRDQAYADILKEFEEIAGKNFRK